MLVCVLVVGDMDKANTDGSFKVPVLRQFPSVAIGQSGTDVPPFVVMATDMFGTYTGYVVLAAKRMNAEKVTAEPLLQPVTVLGHERPMAQPFGFTQLPGVETIV